MTTRTARNASRAEERIRRAENQHRAVELATAGLTYRQIAAQLDLSKSYVHRLVHEALREIAAEQYGDRSAMLAREMQLLDTLARAHLGPAIRGSVQSAQVVLRVSERRAKLLGLDAPVKADVTVATELDREIESLVARLDQRVDAG